MQTQAPEELHKRWRAQKVVITRRYKFIAPLLGGCMTYIIVILNSLLSYIIMTYLHDKNSNVFNDTYYYVTKALLVINIILALYVYVTK